MISIPVSISKSKSKIASHQNKFKTAAVATLGQLAFLVERHCWSPCVWSDGIRRSQHYIFCQFAALDFDDGKMTISKCRSWLKHNDIAHIIGTTKSHQKTKISGTKTLPAVDRFRLIIPLSKAMSKDTEKFKFQMSKIMQLIPDSDKACKDPARFYYPCSQILYIESGNKLKTPTAPSNEKIDDQIKAFQHRDNLSGKRGKIANEIKSFLDNGAAVGQRRPMIFKASATLKRYGWDDDKIKQSILNSPFDKTNIPTDEIIRHIVNGIKAALG